MLQWLQCCTNGRSASIYSDQIVQLSVKKWLLQTRITSFDSLCGQWLKTLYLPMFEKYLYVIFVIILHVQYNTRKSLNKFVGLYLVTFFNYIMIFLLIQKYLKLCTQVHNKISPNTPMAIPKIKQTSISKIM